VHVISVDSCFPAERAGVKAGDVIVEVNILSNPLIDHFTVVCSVTWPLYGSEARIDLVLIQTSLLLLRKTSCSDAK